MAHLFLELFSEEIPARMQAKAEADLGRMLVERLRTAGFEPENLRTGSTPRRLAVGVDGLPLRQPDVREERKGPRVGAPEGAIAGFLKGAGLSSIDQARVQQDPKGDFYLAVIERPGRDTASLLAEIVPDIVRRFDWPKSMRSADQDFTWVRPLRAIACTLDGAPVAFEVGGIAAGAVTFGHRFHAPGPLAVRGFEDYAAALSGAQVMLDRAARKAAIAQQARDVCAAAGLALVEDPGLLEEVTGLVEWPVALLGEMDPTFLALPADVIRLTMRSHQKYFAVRDPKTGALVPRFVVIANIEAKDGGAAIVAGNRRVLSARLKDAQFFWEQDRKLPLGAPERAEKLRQIVFHQKLGSVWDKVERVAALARALAPACGADPDRAEQAARLAKMDLVTETVGEFPELQGQIGRQLYEAAGGDPALAAAIEDHYRPVGPADRAPIDPVAVTVALADKLDTLTGFWTIDEKPTGSSDPYALRRAALGVVRIVLENRVRMSLSEVLTDRATRLLEEIAMATTEASVFHVSEQLPDAVSGGSKIKVLQEILDSSDDYDAPSQKAPILAKDILAFFADRLKVQLREQGQRHDLVDAVFALGDDDLVRIVARVAALGAFLATEDGANLLAGYRRAANILAAEAKKGRGLDPAWRLVPEHLVEPAEKALAAALAAAAPAAADAVAREDFTAAMQVLAPLRAPVDAFFEEVLVNAPEEMLRRNRLVVLSQFRDALASVADFSKIEG